jgi:hypothetical protein
MEWLDAETATARYGMRDNGTVVQRDADAHHVLNRWHPAPLFGLPSLGLSHIPLIAVIYAFNRAPLAGRLDHVLL